MQVGQLTIARTNPNTQFILALAQNAADTVDMPGVPAGQSSADGYLDGSVAPGSARMRIRSLTVISVENLAWEVWLWAKDTFATGAGTFPTGQVFPLAKYSFQAGDAVRIAAAGLYYYNLNGIDLPYEDADASGELHLMLINRSAASKTAGAGGAVQLQFACEPTLGF